MKPLWRSFAVFLRQITGDKMLVLVCLAPVLAALVFRFGIPYLEGLLCAHFETSAIISPYYLLLDLFLCLLTPYMFCFVSGLVMLTEHDENMAKYIAVTPVGKNGYIISRLIFPAAFGFLASVPLVSMFSLTVWNTALLLLACLVSSVLCVAVVMLLFSLSHNRVEGMAIGKLTGLFLLGLVVPFFLESGMQYLFSPLPSFWLAKMCVSADIIWLFPALVSSLLWMWVLYRRFERKLS